MFFKRNQTEQMNKIKLKKKKINLTLHLFMANFVILSFLKYDYFFWKSAEF